MRLQESIGIGSNLRNGRGRREWLFVLHLTPDAAPRQRVRRSVGFRATGGTFEARRHTIRPLDERERHTTLKSSDDDSSSQTDKSGSTVGTRYQSAGARTARARSAAAISAERARATARAAADHCVVVQARLGVRPLIEKTPIWIGD